MFVAGGKIGTTVATKLLTRTLEYSEDGVGHDTDEQQPQWQATITIECRDETDQRKVVRNWEPQVVAWEHRHNIPTIVQQAQRLITTTERAKFGGSVTRL